MPGMTMMLNDMWDIYISDNGGIATTADNLAYGIAQDVANAVRLFTQDAYFDQDRGIPHFTVDLGVTPSMSVVRARIRSAAMSVPGVTSVDVSGIAYSTRGIYGDIIITTDTGDTLNVAI